MESLTAKTWEKPLKKEFIHNTHRLFHNPPRGSGSIGGRTVERAVL